MRIPISARTGLLVLTVTAGCAAEDDAVRPADGPGDRLVAQPDTPLVPEASVTLTERVRIGPGARADAALRRPADVAVDDAGFVYVLDAGEPPRILKFDSAGAFLLHFGHREPDQNRIGRAPRFALTRWNTILLVDRASNALATFLTVGGTFASTIDLTGVGMGVLPRPAFHEIYLHKWDPERRQSYVVHMRTNPIDSIQTTYAVDIPVGRSVRDQVRDVRFRSAVDGEGRLYVAFEDQYAIRVLDPDGTTVRRVGIEREALEKSSREIVEERERNLADLRVGVTGVRDTVIQLAAEPAPAWPLVEEIAVDPSNRMWVRTNRAGTVGTAYDVFNEVGEYLARVDVPGTILRTAFAPDGRLFVIDVEDEASPEVIGYDVTIGEPRGQVLEGGPAWPLDVRRPT